MSSLFNPGKRGILTLLSVVLIIGIPGMIAYADDSTDTYYSASDIAEPSSITVKGDSWYTFGFSAVDNDDGYTIVLDSTASDESTALSSLTVTGYQIYLADFNGSANPVKVQLSTDIDSSSVIFRINDGSYHSFSMTYNDESGVWEVELDSVDLVSIGTVVSASFIVTPESTTAVSEFECSYAFYEKTAIFTDDIVELIVLVGGIALLVIGTFSLSFIDLDTPGKAANSFIRGAKSAGRKVSSYAKGRGKK